MALRLLTSVSFTSVAPAGMSAGVATLCARGAPAACGGPRRPPTRHVSPFSWKLPITEDISVPIFHVPGLSTFTSKVVR